MDLRIADTFTDSLARLTGDEQKAAKTTAFDLQLNPANPGMKFHKLDKAKDKNFWSVRVSADLRIILHRSAGSLLLCYVDHHDAAYHWAERRRLEAHPQTGAAQLVEVRETVKEVVVPVYREQELPLPPKPLLFAETQEAELLGYGVPTDWLDDVRKVNEDSLLTLADRLPAEAAEALLELATGGRPVMAKVPSGAVDPFEHPDAQRRFRSISNIEELQQALEFPWDKWTVFLHPEQRHLIEREFNGPAKVAGSAGTGKTIVALHRAVHLARQNPSARVLLTTLTDTLARALRVRLRRLVGNSPALAERIDVASLESLGLRLHKSLIGPVELIGKGDLAAIITEAAEAVEDLKFSRPFLLTEWEQIVDAWQLDSWEAYRDVARLGRKARLSEKQRSLLWSVFEPTRQAIQAAGKTTMAAMFTAVAARLTENGVHPYEFVVVDEAQDISVAQLKFFAALGEDRSNALFFAGDLGQRIFQQPFSWKSLGVDVRGRSRTLKVNYRTSHQIRQQADRLLGPELADVDGNKEDRRGTVSVFNGPAPRIVSCCDQNAEIETVGAWLKEIRESGFQPHEIGVFVRSDAQLCRAEKAVVAADCTPNILDTQVETAGGKISVGTMHLAKGLEFRAVAVMACDDDVIPSQVRIESVTDDSDLQEIYDTERQLLYVACTRARDQLMITGVDPASEFLEDLNHVQ
jgi:mRNA-degrading endonuclease RelE of RelBE toxin-antitoxin system